MTAAMRKIQPPEQRRERVRGLNPTTLQREPLITAFIKIKTSHFWLLQLMKDNWKTFTAGVMKPFRGIPSILQNGGKLRDLICHEFTRIF